MRSTRTRTARRSTWTSCWRSASAPRRPPDTGIRGPLPPTTAVIAAAGSGERLGAGGPKALALVAGRPMLEWSLEAMGRARSIVAGVVAAPPSHLDEVAELVRGAASGEPPAFEVVPGGESRSESVAAALEAVGTDVTLVHDAARPLVTPELIDGVVEDLASEGCEAVVAATRATDTVKRAAGHDVERTLDRSSLWAAQTPQAFRTDALRRAVAAAERLEEASDDAMLVERLGGRVVLHEAPAENLKVTTELDLRIAELLLGDREDPG